LQINEFKFANSEGGNKNSSRIRQIPRRQAIHLFPKFTLANLIQLHLELAKAGKDVDQNKISPLKMKDILEESLNDDRIIS
jgi:hypothetical protein